MARISTYTIDQLITENDKWIGTDSSGGVTKNFTPGNLAGYFNESNSLGTSDQIAFRYHGYFNFPRPAGSITLQSFQPAFSNITTAKVSKENGGRKLIVDFLDTLSETEIIISDALDINSFGKYYLRSISQDTVETDFYDLELEFIEGNGSFINQNVYVVAFHSYIVENDKHYTHTQFNPSSIWEVNHNLNKYPSVTAVNSNNVVYFGNVTYTDANNLTIEFSGGFSGKAYIN